MKDDIPEAEMGCHPADETGEEGKSPGAHDISFYCDDIKKTVEELRGRGVEFTQEIVDMGYGLVTCFKMPGLVLFSRLSDGPLSERNRSQHPSESLLKRTVGITPQPLHH